MTTFQTDRVETAIEQHQAGNLDQAERIYLQILAKSPNDTNILHLLGCVHLQRGEHRKAQNLIDQAIKINPSIASFHNNIGTTLLAQGKLKAAVTHYRQAVQLKPDYAQAYYNLGCALIELRRWRQAEAICRQGLKIQPHHFALWNNLGRALQEQGRHTDAQQSYRQAIRFKPDLAQAHANLGNVLRDQDQHEEAIQAYQKALELDSTITGIHAEMGHCFQSMGRAEEAIACYRKQIRLTPDDPQSHSHLAAALRINGHLNDAILSYREVIRLAPNHAQGHLALGDALRADHEPAKAELAYRQSLRINPNHAETLNNLGFSLMTQGRVEEALDCYRQALRIKPGLSIAQSNLALFMNYSPDSDAASVAREYRRWAKKHGRSPVKPPVFTNSRNPDRRLRVGYLSPAFREHPVGFFIDSFLGRHDQSAVESYCYAHIGKPDGVTERLRSYAHHWRWTRGCSDNEIQQMIQQDQIDILVVAANHTAGHQMAMVSQKPAPIQVSWLEGPPVTTGLTAMDYVITDRFQSPPGQDDQLFTESVYRMPDGYVCYQPPADAPEVAPLPALKNRHITFGCFNALSKINATVIQLWAQVLHRVPGSRLLMKTWPFKDELVRDRYLFLFAEHGIERSRIDLEQAVPRTKLLAAYTDRVDISLDPFPYSGGVTTLEALWMGVPVVTLNPAHHAVRHSVSHLSNMGLQELIADTEADYVERVVELCADIDRLTSLRASLRSRMSASPVCDADKFVRNLEHAYRQMWHHWCENRVAA